MTIILFGMSGSGKTTVGELLARQLGWNYYDADDFHSAESVEKMRRGIPLSDSDRWPWLRKLREVVSDANARKENVVLACSALKKEYRSYLDTAEVKWIYLKGDYKTIAARQGKRDHHFFAKKLLRSQFETLEEPGKEAMTMKIEAAPEVIVRKIRTGLRI